MIPATTPHPRTVFTLPADLLADSPPEARGVARDDVRLLVAAPTGLRHARFPELGRFLEAGDVVCVNTSATRPAAVDGTLAGRGVVAHLAGSLDDGSWLVEIREPQGTGPARDAAAGASVQIAGGAVLTLLAGYPDRHRRIGSRLWVARVDAETPVLEHLDRYGRPISYGYVRGRWPLAAYQTVFARDPGSAEMPSAGRPFSDRLVTDLVARGVVVAPVLLHTGL
ncbi:MAG TPA: S-adenosylmethionine:tRNA ribosyltransferase-isomerase, partial [Mycobacteriales bacterium]|nr:S-adenosylmethionine:tRNA ribosyltransferase-isomerase [Mycobacteriales bacterium]